MISLNITKFYINNLIMNSNNKEDISIHYKFLLVDSKRALKINLNKVEITNAEYGSLTNKINVLDIIYNLIKKKKKNILVDNCTFKDDPHYKKVKQLYLTLNNYLKLQLDENNILTYDIEYNKINNNKIDLILQQMNKMKIDNLIIKNNKNIINQNEQIKKETEVNTSNELNKYKNFYKNYINFDPIIGFIILRKVVDSDTDKLWIRCYDSIRKFYDNRILIIDDNSDYKYLTVNKDLINTSIIYTEYKNRGEILCLYYYHKYNFCDRVIILHDSMYINKKIDFVNIDNFNNYTRIFSFSNKWYNFDSKYIEPQINKLSNNEELLNYHKLNKDELIGCFGCCMVIEHHFLNFIVNKYNLFNLLELIKNRNHRKGLERTLSCILKKSEKDLNFNTTTDLYGTIHKHVDLQKDNLDNVFIYKEFVGR